MTALLHGRSKLVAMGLWFVTMGCGPPSAEPKPATPSPMVVVTARPTASAAPTIVPEAKELEELLTGLEEATGSSREELLEKLSERFGGAALVRALDAVPESAADEAFMQTQQIMNRLKELGDPRAADPLVRWLETGKPSPHWVGEAATRLAELGDVRAATYLAERIRLEPSSLYSLSRPWESDAGGHLSRSDIPRIVAVRMLGELAFLHPDERDLLEAAAETAVLDWLDGKPQPHPSGFRFLAAIGSARGLDNLRKWAFPTTPLPKVGAQPPFPAEIETATSALRFIGWVKDEPSFSKLLAQLKRKTDRRLDITEKALADGDAAMLGMALRGLAFGASSGLEHWGDRRARKPLIDFIEDETWHEEARIAACKALAWSTDDPKMLLTKAKEFSAKKGAAKELIATCYLEGVVHRSTPELAGDLADLFSSTQQPSIRTAASRALARLSLDDAVQSKLEQKLTDKQLRVDAAVALLLGGARPMAPLFTTIASFSGPEQEEVKDHADQVFRGVVDDDPTEARVGRWALRAEMAAHISTGGTLETWLREHLSASLRNSVHEAGPHTRSLYVLRYRLLQLARGTDPAAQKRALVTLSVMKERGSLAALAAEPGDLGELAKRALTTLPAR